MVTQHTTDYIRMEIPKPDLKNRHINPVIKLHHAQQFAEFEKYNRESREMIVKRDHPIYSDTPIGGKTKLSKVDNYSN